MENFRSEREADHIIELVAQKEECMVAATHALVLKKQIVNTSSSWWHRQKNAWWLRHMRWYCKKTYYNI